MNAFISHRVRFYLLLSLLVVLAVFSVLHIEKNTSPFFLEESHPARANHILHQQVFKRSGYSTFAILRLKEGTDIYQNELVNTLENMHQALEQLSLLEFAQHNVLAEKYGLKLNEAGQLFNNNDEAITLYNSLLKTHNKTDINKHLTQYLFPLKSIKSLINTDNIYEQEDELIVESSYKAHTHWAEEDKRQIADNTLLEGSMFSSDQRGVIIQIEFAIDDEDTELNLALTNKIQTVMSAQTKNSTLIESVHYAGGPVLNNALSEVMEKDNATYFPFVILFVLTTLVLFFRSILCAIYGLVIAVLSILFTMALMPLLGISLNIVTTILPVFIITIAVTDAIHVMSDVAGSNDPSQPSVVKQSIRKLFRPMFLTSLTTGIGFLSLALTEIQNIRGFGYMVALSVVIAFLLSVTLLPFLLTQYPIRAKTKDVKAAKSSLNLQGAFVDRFINIVTRQKWPALVSMAIVLLITSLGLPSLKVDQASIDAFNTSSVLQQDNDMFIESGTGSVVLNVWFKGDADSAILSPQVLKLMQEIQQLVSQHAFYVDSSSIVDFLERIHHVMQGENSAALDLENSELVRQYLFLLEGGAERDLESVATVGGYKQARLAISLARDNSAAIGEIIDEIEQVLKSKLPQGISVAYAGYGWMVYATAEEVFDAQLNSLACSLIAIIFIFLLVFRSVSVTLISMLPLFATLAMMFGIMGVFDYPLDIGSSLVSGIAFGIGIDYSIHLVEAMRRAPVSANRLNMIHSALKQVTLPIGISAIVLSSGFSLLLLSGFKSLASLGLLIMVAMLVSALFTLVIMPYILKHIPHKTFLILVNKDSLETGEQHENSSDDHILLVDTKSEKQANKKDHINSV